MERQIEWRSGVDDLQKELDQIRYAETFRGVEHAVELGLEVQKAVEFIKSMYKRHPETALRYTHGIQKSIKELAQEDLPSGEAERKFRDLLERLYAEHL